MFEFSYIELEARVASLLEGTPLLAEKVRIGRGYFHLGVILPVGFRLIGESILLEQAQEWEGIPVLGPIWTSWVLRVPQDRLKHGHGSMCFQFDPFRPLEGQLEDVKALSDLFREEVPKFDEKFGSDFLDF